MIAAMKIINLAHPCLPAGSPFAKQVISNYLRPSGERTYFSEIGKDSYE